MITSILRALLTRSLKPLAFTNEVDDRLELDVEELGLYVHIPFCRTLCSFCPYFKVKYDEKLAQRYKSALISEINMDGKLYNNKKITSVYFGGGTPALMLNELNDIMNSLRKNFNINQNIGIELHPGDVDRSCLERLREIGFDMVSIGIQSFEEKCLNSLGREYIDGESKIRLAKECGFDVIDVDLIFGMTGQGKEDLKSDFIAAFESGATQVSTYPFIDFSYASNKDKPLDRKEKKELLSCLEETSRRVFCNRTSVWTFAKKGPNKYSSITRDIYIGFGPSAATLTREAFKINTFSVEEYIACVSNNKRPTALTMKFNKRTRALYWLFWNAYTLKLDNKEFNKLFHEDINQVFNIELKIAILIGLVKKIPGGYELTKRGTYLYHLLEQKYTRQYIDKVWRIAGKEAWPEKIKLY